MPYKVLVVSAASHSGGPRVLLDVCKTLVKRGYEFRFLLLLKSGPWIPEFEAIGTCADWPEEPIRKGGRSWLKYELAKSRYRGLRRRFVVDWQPDVVYCNTASTCRTLYAFRGIDVPVVMHVHELDSVTHRFCIPFKEDFLAIPNHYIAVSESVRNHLIHDWGIDRARVDLCYEATDPQRIEALMKDGDLDQTTRKDTYVVGGLGKVNWRKGTDLWLHMADEVRRRLTDRKVRFVWCGPKPTLDDGGFRADIFREIQLLGLDELVEFTGFVENPFPVIQQFDVLAMTSREDPCPLSNLEAMYLQKPVVYFAMSGGSAEVVRDDAGTGIEHLSASAMACEIADLLRDRDRRLAMGQIGRERVLKEFATDVLASKLEGIFADVVKGHNRGKGTCA